MGNWIPVDEMLKEHAQYEDRELMRLRGLVALMEEEFSGIADDD